MYSDGSLSELCPTPRLAAARRSHSSAAVSSSEAHATRPRRNAFLQHVALYATWLTAFARLLNRTPQAKHDPDKVVVPIAPALMTDERTRCDATSGGRIKYTRQRSMFCRRQREFGARDKSENDRPHCQESSWEKYKRIGGESEKAFTARGWRSSRAVFVLGGGGVAFVKSLSCVAFRRVHETTNETQAQLDLPTVC